MLHSHWLPPSYPVFSLSCVLIGPDFVCLTRDWSTYSYPTPNRFRMPARFWLAVIISATCLRSLLHKFRVQLASPEIVKEAKGWPCAFFLRFRLTFFRILTVLFIILSRLTFLSLTIHNNYPFYCIYYIFSVATCFSYTTTSTDSSVRYDCRCARTFYSHIPVMLAFH